jgi:hypothetical protein
MECTAWFTLGHDLPMSDWNAALGGFFNTKLIADCLILAGAEGLEPPNGRTKTCCLTNLATPQILPLKTEELV